MTEIGAARMCYNRYANFVKQGSGPCKGNSSDAFFAVVQYSPERGAEKRKLTKRTHKVAVMQVLCKAIVPLNCPAGSDSLSVNQIIVPRSKLSRISVVYWKTIS